MTTEQLVALEGDLERAGYKKYTSCLTSREDWGWFRSWNDIEGEEKRLRYMIEYRIWDYTKYLGNEREPYGLDIIILDGDSDYRIDLEITSPKFNIDITERIAEDLHKMLAPYVALGNKNENRYDKRETH